MPKLPNLAPRKLIHQLKVLGFEEDHVTGSHVILYHRASGRRAVVPIHRRDLPKGTLASILREARIDPSQII